MTETIGTLIDIDFLLSAIDDPFYEGSIFASPTSIVISGPTIDIITYTYYGSFEYEYNGGINPTSISGTINRITYSSDNLGSGDHREWEISGFSITVDELDTLTLPDLLSGDDVISGAANNSAGWINEVLYGFDGNDRIFGLSGNDLIYGGAGNDIIDGGSGTDAMVGQTGDDTYFVDHVRDTVFERIDQGYDKVWTTVGYTLDLGAEIEELLLLDSGATTPLSLTGNDYGQLLRGNNGANVLDGKGGADVMRGFGGDDTYYVDHVADKVIEVAGGGTDTVYASLTFSLGAGQEIEFLRASDVNATATMNLTGNEGAQRIFGNVGANKLIGLNGDDRLYGYGGADQLYGGAGNDMLSGGVGNDSFIFNTPLNAASNVDTILDFTNKVGNDDRIMIDDAFFARLTQTGPINAAFFKANLSGTATDSNDFILYETDTGKLFYDADGNGAGTAVLFAILTGAPTLTASDFVVF